MLYRKEFDFYLPWDDSNKWTYGFWYPVPIEECSDLSEPLGEHIPDHWDIFTLKKDDDSGDIDMPFDTSLILSFRQALAICEAHNGQRLYEREE